MSERPRTMTAEHWRVGNKVRRTVYENDQIMFLCTTAEDAERVVSKLNAHDSSEQTIRELRDRLEVLTEPGTPVAIVSAMFDFAIAECGHPKYSARHAMTTIRQTVQRERELSDSLAAALKAAIVMPRPWMDGGVSYREWDAVMSKIEAALAQHAAMRASP